MRTEELNVDDIWDIRLDIAIPHKKPKVEVLYHTFRRVIEATAMGCDWTHEEMVGTAYWDYIRSYHGEWLKEPLNRKARMGMRWLFRNGVHLFHDIRMNGMTNPLNFVEEWGKTMLYRGHRRLVILKVLGTERAMVEYATVYHNPSLE
jgi:hypothetical protein